MNGPTCQVSFISAFAQYVHDNLNAIGATWMAQARETAEIPRAIMITKAELEDHVPELMGELVSQLRDEGYGSIAQASNLSRIHGHEQWKAGYNPSHLIWEIYIIRRVLTNSVLRDFVRDHPEYSSEESRQAETLIHDFFHRLTCDSVEQLVEEQQRAIQERNERLEQINEARERLARTVSHELRNVLNALTLTTHVLAEESDPGERQEMIRGNLRMMGDMTRLLNDLLDYSALMAGRSELSLEEFSLPVLFEEIVSQWRPVANEQGVEFRASIDPRLKSLVSDRMKLKQIAGNLLSNAIKYRKPREKAYVELEFAEHGDTEWKLVVADNGIGISSEDLGKLFGEFVRMQPAGPVTGTGLGLTICKEFAELLGGRVEVESGHQQGSRFEAILPRKAEGH